MAGRSPVCCRAPGISISFGQAVLFFADLGPPTAWFLMRVQMWAGQQVLKQLHLMDYLYNRLFG